MLTFLFWNLKRNNVQVLTNLVRAQAVDVVILAECPILPATVLVSLNRNAPDFYYSECECEKIQLYTRFSDEYVLPVKGHNKETITGDDFTIRRFALPGGRPEVMLCAVHFPSKLLQNPTDQTMYANSFAKVLAEAEAAATHERTLLVGDLNMNPYEDGVVTAQGLHAVMSRWIAKKETRTVKFQSNLYFYNPMWAHFGEKSEGHAGTYYYQSPKARADFWNIYDQVLVRPALLDYFRDEDVAILHQDLVDNVSLLAANGVPDERNISDHLPILFRLHI